MINELDIVTLTHDVTEHHLSRGDRGTVVHCYSDGKAYEVEFIGNDGRTTALLTLTDADIELEIPLLSSMSNQVRSPLS